MTTENEKRVVSVTLLEAPPVLVVRTHEEYRPDPDKRPHFVESTPTDTEYVPKQELTQAEERVRVLERVLRFYADSANWQPADTPEDFVEPVTTNDGGMRARGALAALDSSTGSPDESREYVPAQEARRYREALKEIERRGTASTCPPGTTEWQISRSVAAEVARAALSPAPEPEPCDHEWIDMRNEIIESGEMCRKCGRSRAGNEESPEPEQEPA